MNLLKRWGTGNGKRKTPRKPTVRVPERRGCHLTPGLAPPASPVPIEAAAPTGIAEAPAFLY